MCFRLHCHRWRLIKSYHVEDVSFGEPGVRYTRYLKICDVCGKLRTGRIAGTWSTENLLGGA